jgi:hypothetical protein
MKKLLPLLVVIFAVLFSMSASAQIFEDFESSDSTLPVGWTKVNNAAFPISVDPDGNWTVRDSGQYAPGLATSLTQAHNSLRSVGVSWYAGVDTNTGTYGIADAWLITPRFVPTNDNWKITFWATGGSTSFADSMQVWLSLIDSLPNSFTDYIGTCAWPTGSTYGNWTQYTFNVPPGYVGINLWVGFRYYMDCAVDGYFVYLDDVEISDPTSVTQVGNNLPEKFALGQNYPNPFNPSTKIRFDIAKNSNVSLVIYNSLGQQVKSLVNEFKTAGYYEAEFAAGDLPSGTYFYRLTTDNFVETKKMLLVK